MNVVKKLKNMHQLKIVHSCMLLSHRNTLKCEDVCKKNVRMFVKKNTCIYMEGTQKVYESRTISLKLMQVRKTTCKFMS